MTKQAIEKWWASGAGIAQHGPFDTEQEARESMRLTDDARERQRKERGTASPYPHDLVVWCGSEEPWDGPPEEP